MAGRYEDVFEEFTASTLPDPRSYKGKIILRTDLDELQFSDGVSWGALGSGGTVDISSMTAAATAGTDGERTALREALGAVGYRAPMSLTDADLTAGQLILNAEAHANRLLLCNFSTSVQAVLNADATTGASNDDTFILEQTNAAGFITGLAGTASLTPTPAYRISTFGVGTVVQFQRKGLDAYRPIEPLVPLIVDRKQLDYVSPLDTNTNTITTWNLPPLLPNSRVEVLVNGSGSAGAGNKTLEIELDAAGAFSGNTGFSSTAVNGTVMLGFFNRGATNSQKAMNGSNASSPYFGTSANLPNTKTVQTANATVLKLTVRKGTGTDVWTCDMAELRIWL